MNAKPTALDAYLARTAAIHAKLERLQQLADDHFGHDPDAIHWGHVGDLVGWIRRWTICWRSSAAMSDDTYQPREIAMTAQAKLTDTQTAILKAAASRTDGNIEPLPATLRGGGYLVGASAGHLINPSLRVEGEFALRGNSVRSAAVSGLDTNPNNADIASVTYMINVLYDFEGWQTSLGRLRLFVGAGLGWAGEIDADLKIGGAKQEFEGNGFAYQLMAGGNWYFAS